MTVQVSHADVEVLELAPSLVHGCATPSIDELFRRYSPYVARIGYRLLGRNEEVDDLVQDVFLAAHQGIGELRDADAMRGWLATVTVRTAHKRLRRRRIRALLHIDTDSSYEQVAPDASPEQQAMLASIYRQLDAMPAKQRVPWTLHYVEGETLERVALLCSCSLATAKRRIKATQDAIQKETWHAEDV